MIRWAPRGALLSIIVASQLFASSTARANPFDESDKQKHLAASFALGIAFGLVMPKKYALASAIGVGFVKEATDKFVDPGDLGANLLGVMLTIPIDF